MVGSGVESVIAPFSYNHVNIFGGQSFHEEKTGFVRHIHILEETIVENMINLDPRHLRTWCFKIREKVSSNIASEATYISILSGQKLIKNAKIGQFWRVVENLKLEVKKCYQTSQF